MVFLFHSFTNLLVRMGKTVGSQVKRNHLMWERRHWHQISPLITETGRDLWRTCSKRATERLKPILTHQKAGWRTICLAKHSKNITCTFVSLTEGRSARDLPKPQQKKKSKNITWIPAITEANSLQGTNKIRDEVKPRARVFVGCEVEQVGRERRNKWIETVHRSLKLESLICESVWN